MLRRVRDADVTSGLTFRDRGVYHYRCHVLLEDRQMCLNCGCMRAHDDMGKPGVNITYEDVKRAADANGKTVDETLETIASTADKDRGEHPAEYEAG